jgi:hypothetical protein
MADIPTDTLRHPSSTGGPFDSPALTPSTGNTKPRTRGASAGQQSGQRRQDRNLPPQCHTLHRGTFLGGRRNTDEYNLKGTSSQPFYFAAGQYHKSMSLFHLFVPQNCLFGHQLHFPLVPPLDAPAATASGSVGLRGVLTFPQDGMGCEAESWEAACLPGWSRRNFFWASKPNLPLADDAVVLGPSCSESIVVCHYWSGPQLQLFASPAPNFPAHPTRETRPVPTVLGFLRLQIVWAPFSPARKPTTKESLPPTYYQRCLTLVC